MEDVWSGLEGNGAARRDIHCFRALIAAIWRHAPDPRSRNVLDRRVAVERGGPAHVLPVGGATELGEDVYRMLGRISSRGSVVHGAYNVHGPQWLHKTRG